MLEFNANVMKCTIYWHRAYYRCTHKSQGCPATKQVQRSDDDPAVFEVIYRGKHTCVPVPVAATTAPPASTTDAHNPSDENRSLLLNFRTGLKVMTHDLDQPDRISPPLFSFPSMESVGTHGNVFSPSPVADTPVAGGVSPAFISPATSESSSHYLPVSSGPSGQLGSGSMSELADIISGATLGSSSGLGDMDFLQYSMDNMDPNSFPFDNILF